MLNTGPGTPSMQPKINILPKRGWHGKAARWRPKGVRPCFPSGAPNSKAPRSSSVFFAINTELSSGGSGVVLKNSEWLSTPIAQSCKYTFSRGTRFISGSVLSVSASTLLRDKSRMQTPGWTRPARPLRCFSESFAQYCSLKCAVLLSLSMPVRRSRQVSMTTVTSGTVTDVSATLVHTMIFKVFPGGNVVLKASCCSSAFRAP
mmetsp:Transcript_23768/g.68457  ORF Transcript_23768/g.68457 Transcript_23768/m.68457 type:complete len:204 (-) Transcript_23768:280-891(-)